MSTPTRPRPFPWGTLDSTTRAEAAALRATRCWAEQHARLAALPGALSELLGAEVRVLVRRARPLTGARPLDGGVAAVVAPADSPQVVRGAVIEVERALAAWIVARVMKRPPARIVDVSTEPASAVAGAFAAVVAAAVRRAHAGAALRVLSAGPAAALEADVARLDPDLVALTLTVLVNDDAFAARVVVSRSIVASAPPGRWGAAALAALGSMPLDLPIVACAVRATAADVAALRAQDVFLPGHWPLERAVQPASAQDAAARATTWVGPVSLAAASADVGTRAQLGEGGQLVLRGELVPLCAAEAEMSDGQAGGLVETVGEVPVVVRVEIGEARMAAREWAALGRGDVVALGRRVGETVLLRVGGVPVARGELVEIDGEVGVRILERLGGEVTAT